MRRKSITEEQKNEYRRVAYYYYKEGLTQEEIAKRMKMSRPVSYTHLDVYKRQGVFRRPAGTVV